MKSLVILLALMAVPQIAQPQCPDSARVYDVQQVDVPPHPWNVADFMAALREGYAAGAGDTVQVALVVHRDGVPGEIRVRAAPDSGRAAATLRAVSLLRFTPAQLRGRAVAVRMDLPVTADLDVASVIAKARALAETVGTYDLRAIEVLPRPLNPSDFARAMVREFPRELRDAGQGGIVVVRFRVDADGTPGEAEVTCSTHPAFNEPTLRAVEVLRFSPAQVRRRPVPVWIEQPVTWEIARDPGSAPDAGRSPSASENGEKPAAP